MVREGGRVRVARCTGCCRWRIYRPQTGQGRDIGGQATAWAMAQRSGFTLRAHMDSDLQRREKAVARPGRARVRESQLRKHVRDSRPVLILIVIALTITLTQANV